MRACFALALWFGWLALWLGWVAGGWWVAGGKRAGLAGVGDWPLALLGMRVARVFASLLHAWLSLAP
jgi:hypothetical protein